MFTKTFIHKGSYANKPEGNVIIPWRREHKGPAKAVAAFTKRANTLANARYVK